jgi:hypothetical protein
LIISALVGDEAVEYLLPNALFRRRQNPGALSFLDGVQPVPERNSIAWRSAPAFDTAFAWNACHSYPDSLRMIFVSFYQRDIRLLIAKTFGHLSDRAEKTETDRALTQEHYTSNKVFVSRNGITAFAYVSANARCRVSPRCTLHCSGIHVSRGRAGPSTHGHHSHRRELVDFNR